MNHRAGPPPPTTPDPGRFVAGASPRIEALIATLCALAVVCLFVYAVLFGVESRAANERARDCERDGGMALESARGLVCADSAIIIAR